MRRPSSSTTRLVIVAACCLAVVLSLLGACTGGRGVVHGVRRPRPPSSAVLGVGGGPVAAARVEGYAAAVENGVAAVAEQDYGYVDPTPDTRRRGGTAPIPHN